MRHTARVPDAVRNFDLMIIGAGSGNSVIGPEHDDWDVAIVERDLFGGTCLNVGCIPSKMFVYTAEMAELAAGSRHLGVHTRFDGADWPSIRDRIFGRIDPIAEAGRVYREDLSNVTVYPETGRFVGRKRVAVGREVISADRIVIAAGGRPTLPPVPGLEDLRLPHLGHDHAARPAAGTIAGDRRGIHSRRAGRRDGGARIEGDLPAPGRHVPPAGGP